MYFHFLKNVRIIFNNDAIGIGSICFLVIKHVYSVVKKSVLVNMWTLLKTWWSWQGHKNASRA